MRVFALLHAGPDRAAADAALAVDGRAVWELHAGGVVRGAWSTPEGAALALEAADADEAQEHLAALEAVRGGACELELAPVTPHVGLGRLFGRAPELPAIPDDLLPRGRTGPVLAVDRPGSADLPPGLRRLLDQEVAEGWALTRAGLLRESHLRADRIGAVLVLEAEDAAHAQRITQMLALVRAGLLTFLCLPLQPFAPWQQLLDGA